MNPVDHVHAVGHSDGCAMCQNDSLEAENARLRRSIRFLGALRRVQRTGSPAARSELRDARLDMEAHGEKHRMFDLAGEI